MLEIVTPPGLNGIPTYNPGLDGNNHVSIFSVQVRQPLSIVRLPDFLVLGDKFLNLSWFSRPRKQITRSNKDQQQWQKIFH
jgi:hypothetical protein